LFTIRSRLLLLVLSVLLPGLAGVGWLIHNTFSAEREANERTLRETSRALSQVVDAELGRRAAVAQVLAQSSALDAAPALSPADRRMFALHARRALQGMDGWIELSDASGTLLDTREADTAPAGETLRATDSPAGDPPSALSGTAHIGPLRPAVAGVPAHAAIVQPVVRGGRTVFNIKIAMVPAALQHIVDRQALPPAWVAAVLDPRGVLVARQPGGSSYVGRRATPELAAIVAQRREGSFELHMLENIMAKGFFSTADNGWTFVIAMPLSEFAGQLPAAVQRVALGALVLLGIAVGGALWVSRRIVGSAQSLHAAAAAMQAGQAVQLRPSGIREYDQVGAAMAEAAGALQRGRTELQHQVAEAVERTRLAEQRASQNQRMEALGRLTGGVAHDFNNLLGVISNCAHLLQRLPPLPGLQGPIATTLRAVATGSRLTQHLLRVAGRRPVRPQRLDLASGLPEMQELLHSVLGGQMQLQVQVAEDTWPVFVDAGELEFALINIALNARDAMPAGGRLDLRARNASADDSEGLTAGRWVLITVSDDGAGMALEIAERVFEPFFTTKEVGQGSGLGLSQVHGFCSQAGGAARVASTAGLGTTVSLLLPAAAPVAEEARVADRATEPAGIQGRRVLLVEDNVELGNVTADLLESHGAQVLRAADAAQALALLDTEPALDVVLSDVVMPGPLDGVGLARQVRRERPHLPVVLISGYVASEAALRDFVVLRKPCAQDELLATLRAVLAPARHASSP